MKSIRRRLFGIVMIFTGILVLSNRDLFISYFANHYNYQWLVEVLGWSKIIGGIFVLIEPNSYLFPMFIAPFVASILIGIADEFIAQTFYGLTDILIRIFSIAMVIIEYIPYREKFGEHKK